MCAIVDVFNCRPIVDCQLPVSLESALNSNSFKEGHTKIRYLRCSTNRGESGFPGGANPQLPVKPGLVRVIDVALTEPLNEPEQPAVWLKLNVTVPVNVDESTAPVTLPATALLPDGAPHVPLIVVPVWFRFMKAARAA
jgi:hypothetical protein